MNCPNCGIEFTRMMAIMKDEPTDPINVAVFDQRNVSLTRTVICRECATGIVGQIKTPMEKIG